MEIENRTIYIRDARIGDAAQIARFFLMAWPVESFLADNPGMTEDDFARYIEGFVKAEDTIYSYLNTIVAACEDENGNEVLCGAMNGYDGGLYEKMKAPIIESLKSIEPALSEDFAKVKETESGEFYFDSVGVSPMMRSRGIGKLLFSGMEEKAKREGHRTVGLIVDVAKPKAEALYRKIGFEFINEIDFLGNKMKHLQKNLF